MNDFFHITKLRSGDFTDCAQKTGLSVPIEQSPLWGNFDDEMSERQFLGSFRYDDGSGRVVALGSATLYRQRGRDWIWFKHGPLFASVPNHQTVEKFCHTLRHQFSTTLNTQPVFIRLSLPTQTRQLKRPFEHTMYDLTIVLDLTQPLNTLFMKMSASARQAIKKARAAKVTIKEVPPSKIAVVFEDQCYPILSKTAQRAGFHVHPTRVYLTMLKALQPNIHLFVASHKKKVIAWSIITTYQNTAVYYYAASSETARQTEAAYLLQWQVIEQLKAAGITRYDLMGIASDAFPHLENVTAFKKKFSKETTDVAKTYDFPLQPLKYQFLSLAVKMKRLF